MSRIKTSLNIFRNFTARTIVRKICSKVYSRPCTMWVLELPSSDITNSEERPKQFLPEIVFRRATRSDIAEIAAGWPSEFYGIAQKNSRNLTELLNSRFEDEIPCFVAVDNNTIAGAVWCKAWYFDKALPLKKQKKNAYEICNLFVTDKARGRGIAAHLLIYATKSMKIEGKDIAYSRILPERLNSIRIHEKAGFCRLGLLVFGCFLGYRYYKLYNSPIKKQ